MNNLYFKTYKTKGVIVIGEIAAGKVVPFIPHGNKKTLRLPLDETLHAKKIEAIQVKGSSLIGMGVADQSYLIYKRKFHLNEILPHRICIVFIHSTGDLIARRVQYNENGSVTLKAANPAFEDKIYMAEEIEIKGLVIKCAFDL